MVLVRCCYGNKEVVSETDMINNSDGFCWSLFIQGHKKMVLDGVITYFVGQDEKLVANSANEQRCVCCWTL